MNEVYLGVREQPLPKFPALNFGEKEKGKEIDALVLRCLLPLEILLLTSKLSLSRLWIDTSFRASLLPWSTWPLQQAPCTWLLLSLPQFYFSGASLNVWNTDSSCSDWQCGCASPFRQTRTRQCLHKQRSSWNCSFWQSICSVMPASKSSACMEKKKGNNKNTFATIWFCTISVWRFVTV